MLATRQLGQTLRAPHACLLKLCRKRDTMKAVSETPPPRLVRVCCVLLLTASIVVSGCGGRDGRTPDPATAATIIPAGASAAAPTTAPTATVSPTMRPLVAITPTPTATATLLVAITQTPTPQEPDSGKVEVRIPFSVVLEGEGPPADIPECEAAIPYSLIRDGTRTMIEGEGGIEYHFVDEAGPLIFHVLLEFEKDIIPLPFDYAEGSTLKTPWIFVLHLGRSPAESLRRGLM